MLLLPGGYVSTAVAPLEIFQSAGVLWQWLRGDAPQPRFRVRTASVDGREIQGLCGLRLVPDVAIEDIEHTDIIVVPASEWSVAELISRAGVLLPWLKRLHVAGAYIAAVCTGAALLAETGLLDGKRATTHWGMAETLQKRYPAVRWEPEQFVTEDGRLLCSGGIYAATDLSLYLVEKFCGREIALQCAKSLLLSMPRRLQSGYAVVPLSPPHGDEKVREAEAYLQEHFGAGVSVEELARVLAMSPRNFVRRFKAATGRGPGDYVQSLRVAAARELLERRGDQSVQEISTRVGYDDLAFFRQLFRRHTGMSPAEYRERFAGLTFEHGRATAEKPGRS